MPPSGIADVFTLSVFFITGCVFYFKSFYPTKPEQCSTSSNDVCVRLTNKASSLNGLSAIIAFISGTCILLSISDLFDFENHNNPVNISRYIDWCITCPLLQIQLGIIADVGQLKPMLMVFHVFITNFAGLLGALSSSVKWKAIFFAFGCIHFVLMGINLNNLVKTCSGGKESLFKGSSSLRSLSLLTVITWTPFPILWVLSHDGFDIGQLGLWSEVGFNIIGMMAKLSVQITIALKRLEYRVMEDRMDLASPNWSNEYAADAMEVDCDGVYQMETHTYLRQNESQYIEEVFDSLQSFV
ncbi:hypothetical protein P9112_005298 [Eukaryota sp. TZLM1-RC]